MGRLTTLRPRVAMLPTTRVSTSPARAERMVGGSWTKTRERILTRDQGLCRCRACQESGRLRQASIVDHRVPLYAGGTNADENLVSVHPECHALKSEAEAAERAGRSVDGRDALWWRGLPTRQDGPGASIGSGVAQGCRGQDRGA